ncbi:helix-turn-helix transcriptional regulator [Chitinophaga sp. Cy-1792]|uniref:helix-turn-helix transcriptional regulator n=1 Tax=Chitinophaga sp. Cy-1792 TaxID=2608339 RepID=UPI0014213797|nr:helix-turn-helix transcriptional regulator [Chitinophaga sp. Cy-1792]NIG53305.1 helix-turn-helix transcriptional regulator [Chitinophaga sp. Cy-1792]
MLLKFPQDFPGQQILKADVHYAMLKQRRMAEKRRIFLKENLLIFVINGYKILHTETASVRVEAGSVFLLRRGFHILSDIVEDGTDFKSLLIYFSDEDVSRFTHKYHHLFSGVTASTAQHLVIPLTSYLDDFRETYLRYFQSPPDHLSSILSLKKFELFLLLMETPQQQTVATFLQAISTLQPPEIEWVVRRHIFEPLTLPELARLSNRSLAAFKRDFQQHFGTSPRKWITTQRMLHARNLLFNSPLQIAEISLECGYEHTPHFISLFKQQYGETPQALRSKNAII